jgi:hypothetical protein
VSARCSGRPVSWLQLERYLLDELRPDERRAVRRHLEGCPACASCLRLLQADRARALPPLPARAPAPAPRRRWWPELGPGWAGLAAAGACALVLLLVLPRALERERDHGGLPPPRLSTKGGEVSLTLVRERSGGVALDPSRFAEEDRFKALITCPGQGARWWELVVYQGGEAFFPVETARLDCGNQRPLPGAFSLSGSAPALVCLVPNEAAPLARAALARLAPEALPEGTVCLPVRPAGLGAGPRYP